VIGAHQTDKEQDASLDVTRSINYATR